MGLAWSWVFLVQAVMQCVTMEEYIQSSVDKSNNIDLARRDKVLPPPITYLTFSYTATYLSSCTSTHPATNIKFPASPEYFPSCLRLLSGVPPLTFPTGIEGGTHVKAVSSLSPRSHFFHLNLEAVSAG